MGGGKHPLAFLGKKAFHTKNLKNVEAVWIAEEKEKGEEKKLEALKKQIIEERQMDELRQLQAQAGIGKKYVEKLDWMYEGPMAGATDPKESEEYLLGKAFEPKAVTQEINQQISKHSEQPGSLWSKKPSANDAFTRMHEDPMMKIRQQELKVRESVIKNPLKMNKVKKEIEYQLKMEKEARREQKKNKKEKKEMKKRQKKEKKEKKKSDKRSKSNSGSEEDSDSDTKKKKMKYKEEEVKEEKSELTTAVKDPRFGLQNGKGLNKTYTHDELGPSTEQRNNSKKSLNSMVGSSKRPREKLSEEEKEKRLREMRKDAQEHDERRHEIMIQNKAAKAESERIIPPSSGDDKNPTFLKDMGNMVYLSGDIDMEERVKRNRQHHQKDLGSDSFMRK